MDFCSVLFRFLHGDHTTVGYGLLSGRDESFLLRNNLERMRNNFRLTNSVAAVNLFNCEF